MRHLLALSLCLASTVLASGDELDASFDAVSEPGADSTNAQRPVAVSEGEGETQRDDTTLWRPRLQIILNSITGFPRTKTVKEQVTVSTDVESGAKPGRSVVYREVELQVLAMSMGKIATLYCDSMTLNVLEGGDTPKYSLECKSRVSIRLNGIVIDADSASFDDGKCELVNATLTQGDTTATAPKLTLSVPIHGVLTNSFDRPIPENPPAVNLSNPPDPIGGGLRPVPDPISSPKGFDSTTRTF
ncbi:MAG: hypothetical protein KDB01_14640 [Planctomycetaceae bacterium]|nr:hypothetical protein [Planctomycetaceae bacterium]